MDPISILITALVSGLVVGVGETSKTFVKDSYKLLKDALSKKLIGNINAEEALTRLEESPKSKQARENLDTELRRINLEIDKDTLEIALSLLKLSGSKDSKYAKYPITIQNSSGVVVGDHANVKMNFQSQKKMKKRNRSPKESKSE